MAVRCEGKRLTQVLQHLLEMHRGFSLQIALCRLTTNLFQKFIHRKLMCSLEPRPLTILEKSKRGALSTLILSLSKINRSIGSKPSQKIYYFEVRNLSTAKLHRVGEQDMGETKNIFLCLSGVRRSV